MIKILQKDFILPLPTKHLKIMGILVETGPKPHIEINKQQLTVRDHWNIQLVCTPLGEKDYIVNPTLMEYQVEWQDALDFTEELKDASVNYKKKPRSIASFIQESQDYKATLHLTMEIIVEIEASFSENTSQDSRAVPPRVEAPPKPSAISPKPQLPPEPLPVYVTGDQLKIFEERLSKLEKQVQELLSFKDSAGTPLHDDKKPESSVKACKMSGKIIDAFRLTPIAKGIIEFTLSGQEEPVYKIAADERGVYSLEIEPGVYDIKVKHPRYLLLSLRNYTLKEMDEKVQDFMLRRA